MSPKSENPMFALTSSQVPVNTVKTVDSKPTNVHEIVAPPKIESPVNLIYLAMFVAASGLLAYVGKIKVMNERTYEGIIKELKKTIEELREIISKWSTHSKGLEAENAKLRAELTRLEEVESNFSVLQAKLDGKQIEIDELKKNLKELKMVLRLISLDFQPSQEASLSDWQNYLNAIRSFEGAEHFNFLLDTEEPKLWLDRFEQLGIGNIKGVFINNNDANYNSCLAKMYMTYKALREFLERELVSDRELEIYIDYDDTLVFLLRDSLDKDFPGVKLVNPFMEEILKLLKSNDREYSILTAKDEASTEIEDTIKSDLLPLNPKETIHKGRGKGWENRWVEKIKYLISLAKQFPEKTFLLVDDRPLDPKIAADFPPNLLYVGLPHTEFAKAGLAKEKN